ncbi:MAG: Lrp/AsnC family transcriptional regulator [Candidatus Micrarchaeaceae archaeon]
MEEVDEEILSLVDSGITRYTAIAKKLNMNLSTVHFRIKKLEKAGIIKRYRGDIDWAKAGFPFMAFVFVNIDVDLLKKLGKTQEQLLKELLGNAFVREGYVITGDQDIMLRVIARDSAHFKDILLKHIDSKSGVVKTKTIIAL